jgi:preprotein translocase subunit SecG
VSNFENLIILGIIFFILSIIFSLIYFRGKSDWKTKFVLHKKAKALNYRKLLKWWIFLQSFTLITHWNQILESWVLVFIFPMSIVFLIITYYFSNRLEVEDKWINTDEAIEYKKVEERDKKIKRILK